MSYLIGKVEKEGRMALPWFSKHEGAPCQVPRNRKVPQRGGPQRIRGQREKNCQSLGLLIQDTLNRADQEGSGCHTRAWGTGWPVDFSNFKPDCARLDVSRVKREQEREQEDHAVGAPDTVLASHPARASALGDALSRSAVRLFCWR